MGQHGTLHSSKRSEVRGLLCSFEPSGRDQVTLLGTQLHGLHALHGGCWANPDQSQIPSGLEVAQSFQEDFIKQYTFNHIEVVIRIYGIFLVFVGSSGSVVYRVVVVDFEHSRMT